MTHPDHAYDPSDAPGLLGRCACCGLPVEHPSHVDTPLPLDEPAP